MTSSLKNKSKEGVSMLGQSYFESRLNEIYNYCLVSYLCGSGELVSTDSKIKTHWELCQDVSGEIIFILSSSSIIETDKGGDFVNFVFKGISNDNNWEITSEKLVIHSQKIGWSLNDEQITYFCSTKMVILKHRHNYRENSFSKALAYLHNFKFIGLDWTKYETINRRDKFNCQVCNRDIHFKLLYENKNIEQLIENDRIAKAVLSTMEYPVNDGETIEFCIEEIEKISYFLSITTLNTNFSPMIELFSGEEKVAIIIKRILSLPYHGNFLIDNLQIKAGIPSFFIQCFKNYITLSNAFDIDQFVILLLELQNQHQVELKISVLLLAYENLLSKYLAYKGTPINDLKDSSVEQKLRMFNKMFRFIKKDFLGEDLRDSIRNKLFHLGNIPFLSFEEKWEIYVKYYELLIQILLKILDYHGEYINRIDYIKSSI
jgi:hypothetical protein